MSDYAYPLDLTGTATSNLVPNEAHTVTNINASTYFIFIPFHAPFYLDNFILKLRDDSGITSVLFEGIDYEFCIPYVTASDSVGKYLYGGVKLLKELGSGTLLVSYQTLGDKWMGDASYILERVSEKLFNPRTVIWDNITNVQEIFPVADHSVDLSGDIQSSDDILKALVKIADAILAGPSPTNQYITHITDIDSNPHKITAEKIGIMLASDAEVEALSLIKSIPNLKQILQFIVTPLNDKIQRLESEINNLKQQIQ